MGRIISNFFISLDGVVEAPDQWHFPYFNDEMGAAVSEGAMEAAAFLMGRQLYDEWSTYWPGQARTEPEGVVETADDFGAFINAVPKFVVSNTLGAPSWNNTTVISGDVAAGIRSLKAATDGAIAMSGSGTLVRWLLREGLLDELRLLVHPIVVGKGKRLLDDLGTVPLKLSHQQAFETGVLALRYEPAAA